LAGARRNRRRPTERYTHTSTSEDEEKEDDRFDFIVEREIDDERVHRLFVCCDTALVREGIGDDQDMLAEAKRVVGDRERETYPEDPDGHDPFHVALTLGHRSYAGLTTIAWGGRGDLQNLVGIVDVEK
jgi:hypothetical protein